METVPHRFIMLTGVPGVGKTTLIKKVCDTLNEKGIPLIGFFTEEVREHGSRVGFDIVSFSGKRAPLARISSSGESRYPKIGKYAVHVQSFDSLCSPELPDVPVDKHTLLVLDEIGKMELLSSNFQKKIKQYFGGDNYKVILGTVPLNFPRGSGNASADLVQRIKSDKRTLLLTVKPENRNDLADIIVNHICEALNSKT